MSKITKIKDVLAILKEEDLIKEFGEFEDQLMESLKDLRVLLNKDTRSTDVISILDHLTKIDSYRERLSRYYSLCTAFYEHSQGSNFLLTKDDKIKEVEKKSHQKSLGAGFKALVNYTEELLRSTDSRINICKRLLDTK